MWGYTPRRIAAFLFIAEKRRAAELARSISSNALASRGDPKEVKKQLHKLARDGDR